jgi:cytochrome c biogenesis protein CcdA
MLRLIGIVAAIGLADSLNPSTIAPGMLLASSADGLRELLRFTLGTFAVYFIGGILIALGPGQLALSLLPSPDAHTRAVLEIVAGGLLLVAGMAVWLLRDWLRRRQLPAVRASRRSGLLLGAAIMAVELPTAFPYFGAIAAVVGSGYDIGRQVLLLAIYNVCFVLPLLGIAAILRLAGARAEVRLAAARAGLGRNWPLLASALALVLGALIVYLGISGLEG